MIDEMPDWVTSFPGAVTISDREHRVVYMNAAAEATFAARGGKALIGTDLLSYHNPRSRGIIQELLAGGGTNVYTIEKSGTKKLIYQSAWRDSSGNISGLIELSLVLPGDMPHIIRG